MFYSRAWRRRVLPLVVAAFTAVAGPAAFAALGPAAQAATSTLCNSQTAAVGGGTYIDQNNEWNSSASECITTDGNADFTVANSSISNGTNGAPGGYPSIYQGCHWGNCSSGGLTSTPIQASNLTTGKVTTSWSTTQPGSGSYDVAYDIWFNRTSTTTGQPNCMELMVWLNHNGSVQPFGSQVASNVSVGGHSYNIWEGAMSSWNTVSYSMTSGTTSVSNLDVGTLAADAISRGYMPSSCWLIDVEAGFELWQGGAGLATNSFSVTVNGGGGGNKVTVTSPGNQSGTVGTAASVQVSASDSASGQTLTYSASGLPPGESINSSTGLISGTPTASGTYNVTVTARDGTGASGSASFTWTIGTGGGSGACTATFSMTGSWPGGFQGQVTVTAGSSGLSNWTVGWAFPSGGNQVINDMWNATYTQSGQNVTAHNEPYNGSLAAGASTTFGFTTTASTDTGPATLTCS